MSEHALFAKVLVANRGEIACRIIRTLQRLGIASVAIYHASDRQSPHVAMADEALEIAGETPVAAYLDGAAILEVAAQVGAGALHPGYGFLAENAAFAQATVDAGLVFIGPDPAVIGLMGDKIKARAFVIEHGYPVAPSVVQDGDFDGFLAAAGAIGYPLLIKAAAGGGGKGMRIVEAEDTLRAEAEKAAAEAKRYFGDPRIYAERFVERPRHIEVQVLGDGVGGVVHLFERECSIQRRFQKIIEESPAPGLPDDLRQRIWAAAVGIAGAANYLNAGTVEFILAPDGEFYFLEMNTRLQVEHPVTEMITGIDLVETQIQIAAGRGLPFAQADVQATGHAIECRICAEDPNNDFLPETGRILRLEPPPGDGVRFDNGFAAGQEVTAAFDSMLAKLVVHGTDRSDAIDRCRAALDRLVLLGVQVNTDYLARLLGHPAFHEGRLDTGFIDRHAADLTAEPPTEQAAAHLVIAAALGCRAFRALAFEVPEPYASIGAWRN
jgi:propionyl-CoA carboxylase alpha chain/3-methylcrotonyl-CoA carboxylase alpha subunit/acetyl-CoA/propionyl-CoA carboxylase biotin carboxyl carrier protein